MLPVFPMETGYVVAFPFTKTILSLDPPSAPTLGPAAVPVPFNKICVALPYPPDDPYTPPPAPNKEPVITTFPLIMVVPVGPLYGPPGLIVFAFTVHTNQFPPVGALVAPVPPVAV